jgi:hypothetical protein
MTKNPKNKAPTGGVAAEPTTLASLLVALDHAVAPSATRLRDLRSAVKRGRKSAGQ